MNVLVVNCGSSSLKYQLLDMTTTWKCNLVLDVPWFRLFQHQACAIPWDELDLDDSFSSLRNTCTGVQRVALEADFRTNWRTSTLICVRKCHLSFLCCQSIDPSYWWICTLWCVEQIWQSTFLKSNWYGCDWKSRWYDHRNAHHSNCIPDANRSLCELLFKDRNPYWRHIPNVFNNRMDCNWNMRDSFSYSFLFCSASSFHI